MKARYVMGEGDVVRVADIPWTLALAERGLKPGAFSPSWNVSHPEQVRAVIRALVEAGSTVVVANTQRANRGWIPSGKSDRDLQDWNREGIRIAREEAGDCAMIFGCVGTTGRPLASRESTVKWLRECYEFQIGTLAEAGADAILIEGMADLSEARLAVEVAKSRDLPVVATMKFDSGRFRDQTIFGMTVELAASGLVESGADAVGVSGGWGFAGLDVLVRRLRRVSRKPVWARVDRLAPMQGLGGGMTPAPSEGLVDEVARGVESLVEAGAMFLAGGEGTGIGFVRELGEGVRRLPVAGAGANQTPSSLIAA